MQIPYTLNKEIVDFLTSLPNILEQDNQRTLIYAAGFDTPLLNQINFSGGAAQFFQLLLPLLSSYGTLGDGRNAIEALLEIARQFYGGDQQTRAIQLINKVRALRGEAPFSVSERKQIKPVTPVSEHSTTVSGKSEKTSVDIEISKVTIEVGPKTVFVRYANQTYSSPNRIQNKELLQATTPEHYGEVLFNSILHDIGSQFSESDRTARYGYARALEELQERMLIEIALDPNDLSLYEYKWEYLKHPEKPIPLFLKPEIPIYRRLQGISRPIRVAANPLKILVAIASPGALGQKGNTLLQQLAPISVKQERAILEEALNPLRDKGLVDYTILDMRVTPAAIQQALQEGVHILHIIAHGLFIPQPQDETSEYYLVIDRDDNPRRPFVSVNDLHTVLVAGRRPCLVVVSACQSIGKAMENASNGLGPSLVRQGIPAVIAMQDSISMPAAQVFAQYFYGELVHSGRVDTAIAAARLKLYQSLGSNNWEWGFPVLLMSAEDGRMFEIASKA